MDSNTKSKNKIITPPNVLSFIRIVLVPIFLVFYFKEKYVISVVILAISALTDVIDGIIARTFNMISTFGKIIDPIADKLTQAVVVIAISIVHLEFIPIMALLVIKEFFMFLGAVYLFESGARPAEAKWWGKTSTVAIYSFMIGVIVHDVTQKIFPAYWFLWVLAVLVVICTIFSFINYAKLYLKIRRGEYDLDKEQTKE